MLSAAASPRPGNKRIEIRTPKRSKVAIATSYYRDRHGRLSKQAWTKVKEEHAKAGALCSLASTKKIGVRWAAQRKAGVPMTSTVLDRLVPRLPGDGR